MKHDSKSERFVLCSERILLECECGERLVLLGLEEDWYSELRTLFECECGERLSLADRLDEEGLTLVDGSDAEANGVRELLRSLRDPTPDG
jgi:hypothetical protein